MTKIYHTKMADALPSKKRVAEEKARLEKAGIKYILSCWIDMLGHVCSFRERSEALGSYAARSYPRLSLG